MQNYLNLISRIIDEGVMCGDRTGTGRQKLVGEMLKFNLADGFPLVTTKQMPIKMIVRELLWFISGSTDVRWLHNNGGIKMWDDWTPTFDTAVDLVKKLFPNINTVDAMREAQLLYARYGNSIGPLYGTMMRSVPIFTPGLKDFVVSGGLPMEQTAPDKLKTYEEDWKALQEEGRFAHGLEAFVRHMNGLVQDQLQNMIVQLKTNPYSSRILINNWKHDFIPIDGFSPAENVLLGRQALAPCHLLFQAVVDKVGDVNRLNTVLYMRSSDVPVGLPFNIAQYALLTQLLANEADMVLGTLTVFIADAHIYTDQLDLAKMQILRKPHKLPVVVIKPHESIYSLTLDDFELRYYEHDEKILYPVSV